MKEIFLQSSKAKVDRYRKSPQFSSGVPAPFHGSLNEMPLQFIPAIISIIKLRNERINVTANPIGDRDSKVTLFDTMSKNEFALDGLQNLSPEDWPSNTLGDPLAMRPSINGCIGRPPILFCSWGEPIASSNTEDTPGNIKNPIFRSVLPTSLSAVSSAIGKPIPSAVAKPTRRCK